MVLLLVNGSCMCEQDLQLTSASPHVNGAIAQGNAIKHEIHISISTYHAIHRQALSYTMPCPSDHTIYHATSPGHTIYHAGYGMGMIYQNGMSSPPGDIIYHAISLQAIPYALLSRPYHIPCHAHKAVPNTMLYLTRPFDILCHA